MEINQKKITRPWQGTLLGILSLSGVIFSGIRIVLMIMVLTGATNALMNTNCLQAVLSGFGIIGMFSVFILIPMVIFFILGIHIMKGVFRGKKWPIILYIIITVPTLIISFLNEYLFLIIIASILFYLEIICIKHPFYNKNF